MSTATVPVRVHELDATLRGPADPDRPVIVGEDGTRVVVLLSPAAAGVLAKVLAVFEAEHADDDLDFPFERDVWVHAYIDLLSAVALTGQRPVPVPVAAGVPR